LAHVSKRLEFFHGTGELSLARLQVGEQPRVLDGNYGLGSKVREQAYLLVIEGTNLIAVENDGTNHLTTLQQRHAHQSAGPAHLDGRNSKRRAGLIGSAVARVLELVGFARCQQVGK